MGIKPLDAMALLEMADELRSILEKEPQFKPALWFARDLEGKAGDLLRDKTSDTVER